MNDFISEEARERLIRRNNDAADLFATSPKEHIPIPRLNELVEVEDVIEMDMSREELYAATEFLCPAPMSECLVCVYGSMPYFLLNNYFCKFPGATIE